MRQSKPDSLRSYHLRQAIMACTITTLSIPYTIFILCVNVEALQPPPPPTDPEIPGLDFSQISRIPANVWRSSALTVFLLEGNRWTLLLLMVIFFSLFGLLPETIAHYSAMFRPLKKLWKISFQSKPQCVSTRRRLYLAHGSTQASSQGRVFACTQRSPRSFVCDSQKP